MVEQGTAAQWGKVIRGISVHDKLFSVDYGVRRNNQALCGLHLGNITSLGGNGMPFQGTRPETSGIEGDSYAEHKLPCHPGLSDTAGLCILTHSRGAIAVRMATGTMHTRSGDLLV